MCKRTLILGLMAQLSWAQISPSAEVQLEAGFLQSFALRADSSLWFWGKDSLGPATGLGSTQFPTQVNSKKWKEIHVGMFFGSGLLSNGELWVWGSNQLHQLGMVASNQNSAIRLGTALWTTVSAGLRHQVGIRDDGTLWHWGDVNGSGSYVATPTQISSSIWKSVSAGQGFSLAIDQNQHLWAWGNNSAGQLGLGNFLTKISPVQVDTNRWLSVCASDSFSLGIRADSSLWTWGDSTNGRLGHVSLQTSKPSLLGQGKWLQVSSKSGFVLALKSDSTLWAWGDNHNAQLGDTSVLSSSQPRQIPGKWRRISAGWNHSLAQAADGSLWAWGSNQSSQIGNGTQTAASTPLGIGFESQSLTFDSIPDFIYGSQRRLTATTSGNTLLWTSLNSAQCQLNQDTLKAVGVGSCEVKASLPGNANQRPIEISRQTTIIPKDLYIRAQPSSKIYGQPNPVYTWSSQGLASGDSNAVIKGQLSRVIGESVGAYVLQKGTLSAANYTLHFQSDTFEILPKDLIIHPQAQSKVYGSPDVILAWTATGFVGTESADLVTGSLSRANGEDAGLYAYDLGSLEAPNYRLSLNAVDSFRIQKAPLQVTLQKQTKFYGDVDPTLSWSATGFVNQEDASVLRGSPSRVSGEKVGQYALQLGTLNHPNYQITLKTDSLHIQARPVIVKAVSCQKMVQDPDPNFQVIVTGLALGDQESDLQLKLSRKAGETEGFYPIKLDSSNNPNYNISFEADSLEIIKKSQTLNMNWPTSASVQDKIDLVAQSSAGLDLTYRSLSPEICTVLDGRLQMLKEGECELQMNQVGNAVYGSLDLKVKINVGATGVAVLPQSFLGESHQSILIHSLQGHELWKGTLLEFNQGQIRETLPLGLVIVTQENQSQAYVNLHL